MGVLSNGEKSPIGKLSKDVDRIIEKSSNIHSIPKELTTELTRCLLDAIDDFRVEDVMRKVGNTTLGLM